jgi:UDP-glucose 4-epimerase
MTTTVLVTGGAGYIGSHTARALITAGYRPVVFDNLSSGHQEAVPEGVPLVVGDLGDVPVLRRAIELHRPEAVIHFAAFIEAGESMTDPRRFYRNNVQNSLNLFDTMLESGVTRVVFSSSAGVYGQPERVPILEESPKVPVSTYGETKLIVEHILRDYDRAYGLRSISLRYFNACGADPSGEIGEAHKAKTHLIELALLTALGQRDAIHVFGTDYPTPDGTAIRDYIHVTDLAYAHVLALAALEQGRDTSAFNVGVGRGFSVREVLDAVEQVSGRRLERRLEPRRPGDPAALVADATRIKRELGWEPRYTDLHAMIETAWHWHRSHPHDFTSTIPEEA